MPTAVAPALDMLSTKVLLGGECVVGLATQREIVETMQATASEGLTMMELETMGFAATHAALVEVSAATFVALEDGAANARRDVSTAPARIEVGDQHGFRVSIGRDADAFGGGFSVLRGIARRLRVDARLGAIALLLEHPDEEPHRLQVQVSKADFR
ncbi:MAG TPA: hypothetical protein VGQ57_16970 [Polyangiaceae bacterium]|nr:hypothetical protein [Polyangiaceae bacterium]